MDRHVEERGPDTSMLEIKKIVDCLLTNGYEFEGTREAIVGRYSYTDDAIADFKKDIDYTAENGDYIPDNSITVSIQFQKRADYTNFKHFGKKQDEREGDDEYIGDPETFITDLIEEIKLSKNLVKNGGGKKSCKNRGKKRKTKKNVKNFK